MIYGIFCWLTRAFRIKYDPVQMFILTCMLRWSFQGARKREFTFQCVLPVLFIAQNHLHKTYCFLCTWYISQLVWRISQIPLNMWCSNSNLAMSCTSDTTHRSFVSLYFSGLFRTQWKNNGMGSKRSGFVSQIYHKINCVLLGKL